MRESIRSWLLLAAVGLAVGGLSFGAVTLMIRGEGRIAALGGVGGDGRLAFSLVDHTGAARSDADFRGRPVVAYYGYTFCPDICPGTLAALGDALDALGAEGEAVAALFITVDPERDTVAALADYVALFHPRLIGLTGTAAQTDAAAQAARARHERVESAASTHYLVDHTADLFVFDGAGRVIDRLPHGLPPAAIAKRLRAALGRAG